MHPSIDSGRRPLFGHSRLIPALALGMSLGFMHAGCVGDEECHAMTSTHFAIYPKCTETVAVIEGSEVWARFRRLGTTEWFPCAIWRSSGSGPRGPVCPESMANTSIGCTYEYRDQTSVESPPNDEVDLEFEVRIGDFSGRKVMKTGYRKDGCIPANLRTTIHLERE